MKAHSMHKTHNSLKPLFLLRTEMGNEKNNLMGGLCYSTWLSLIGSACNGLKLVTSWDSKLFFGICELKQQQKLKKKTYQQRHYKSQFSNIYGDVVEQVNKEYNDVKFIWNFKIMKTYKNKSSNYYTHVEAHCCFCNYLPVIYFNLNTITTIYAVVHPLHV